jgi:hypothetical protein
MADRETRMSRKDQEKQQAKQRRTEADGVHQSTIGETQLASQCRGNWLSAMESDSRRKVKLLSRLGTCLIKRNMVSLNARGVRAVAASITIP